MIRKILATAAVMSLAFSAVAFAGTWKSGATDSNRWWYDNGDGSYANSGWFWIDGNNDGVAESYCFDQEGWLLTNTTTPDGYQVNANGAWTVNGAVQTQGAAQQPVQEEKQQNQAQSGELQAYTGNPADYAGTYDFGKGYSVTFTVSGNGLMENGDPNMVFHHMDGYNFAYFFIENEYAKDSYIFAAPGVLATEWEYISDKNYAVKKTAARH